MKYWHPLVNGSKLELSSLRNLEFYMHKRCPYIYNLLDLLSRLADLFHQNEEILDYFDWTQNLVNLEKRCFSLFIKDLHAAIRANRNFSIEHILEHEFLHAPSFKDIEREFTADPENQKGASTITEELSVIKETFSSVHQTPVSERTFNYKQINGFNTATTSAENYADYDFYYTQMKMMKVNKSLSGRD